MKTTIGKRLGVLSGVAVILLLVLAVVSWWSSAQVDAAVNRIRSASDAVQSSARADKAMDAVDEAVTAIVATPDPALVAASATELTGSQQDLLDSLVAVKSGHASSALVSSVDAVADDVDAVISSSSAVAKAAEAGAVPQEAVDDFDAKFKVLHGHLPTVTNAAIDFGAASAVDAIGVTDRGRTIIIVVAFLAMVTLIFLASAISRSIVHPIRKTVALLKAVAKGDLGQRLDVGQHDEIGEMADALNAALENLSRAMSAINNHAESLASASEELTAVSSQLAAGAEETSAQAGSVSAGAEEVSSNVTTVAAGMGEMTASIREISINAQTAVEVATTAAVVASNTNETVVKLGASSAEIGTVVKVITSIAEQTNLLALNATIEAARAGEAGKGFAVVANEVKDLARATAEATSDISQRIAAIQSDAEAAVHAIGEITEIIGRVSETQASIASAVEQQTATTNEIGRNVGEAARGSHEIANNVSVMAEAFNHAALGAAQTRDTAAELSHLAMELQQLVGSFQYGA
jgi:methyl-accepting chemotaxis protein